MCVLLDVEESKTINHHVVALLVGHSDTGECALAADSGLHLRSFVKGAGAILYSFGDQFSSLGDGECGHFQSSYGGVFFVSVGSLYSLGGCAQAFSKEKQRFFFITGKRKPLNRGLFISLSFLVCDVLFLLRLFA